MTSDEYERVTKELMETIVEQVEGVRADRVGHGLRNRLKGQSGYRHQIDVSVEGAHDLLTTQPKQARLQVGWASRSSAVLCRSIVFRRSGITNGKLETSCATNLS